MKNVLKALWVVYTTMITITCIQVWKRGENWYKSWCEEERKRVDAERLLKNFRWFWTEHPYDQDRGWLIKQYNEYFDI